MPRYIDADKLIAYLTDGLIEFYNCDGHRMIPEEVKEIMERAVEHMEIADVREVVHGKWDMKPDPYGFFDEIPVCSECGMTTTMRNTYDFCPYCGTDMRG